jgi:hypothetical protein
MSTNDKRIEAIETRIKQLRAQKQQVEARKRAEESKRKRSDELRRKILVGTVMLARVERGELPMSELHEMLDQALVKADERQLFELPQRGDEADRHTSTESKVKQLSKPVSSTGQCDPAKGKQNRTKVVQVVEQTTPTSGPDSLF